MSEPSAGEGSDPSDHEARRKARQKSSPLGRLTARVRESVAKSGRIFLLGLVIACGVEVVVDLSSTLHEINVLRTRMRDRGTSYVAILSRSCVGPLERKDSASLASMSQGVFDDEDVLLVRFVGADGALLHEHLDDEQAKAFLGKKGEDFRTFYAHQLSRDVDGVLRDLVAHRQRMEKSRYRDFVQAYNDFLDGVAARFVGKKPSKDNPLVVYQDRLYDKARRHDATATWAIGLVVGADQKPVGAIVVAFSMERTNAAIARKYLQGAGMIAFFVALILIQNVSARRDKLRLLDLEARQGHARRAVAADLPEPRADEAFSAAGAIDQSPVAVDGAVFDVAVGSAGLEVLVLDPDGDGIDAVAVALHALRAHRARGAFVGSPLDAVTAIGADVAGIPLSRPIGVVLVRVDRAGVVEGLATRFGGARIVVDGVAQPLDEETIDPVDHVLAPLRSLRGALPEGALLVIGGAEAPGAAIDEDEVTKLVKTTTSVATTVATTVASTAVSVVVKPTARAKAEPPAPLDVDALAGFVARAAGEHVGRPVADLAHDAATWARGNFRALVSRDISVVVAERLRPVEAKDDEVG